ncbi:hypothetical protein ACP70R_033085 [Stipagrostis hirtigluma subsp. patula]
MAVGTRGEEVAMCTQVLVARVLRSRWFMMFASMVVMAASGSMYLFPLYTNELRLRLGYNQQTLNTLSFFKDLGCNVGIVSGLVHEVAPSWVMLLIGASMNLVGYLMIYLALTARIAAPPVWLMCLYIWVGANAFNFANTGVLVACVKNFPEGRGFVIGLLKGFLGLSSAIFTQFYLAIYGNDAKSLVLLIACLPSAVYIFFMHTTRVLPCAPHPDSEVANKPFFYFLYISIALAVNVLAMIILQKHVQFSHAAYIVCATVLIIILFLPLGVVVWIEYKAASLLDRSLQQPPTIVFDASTMSKKDDHSSRPLCGGGFGCISSMFKPPALGDDYSIMQALVSVEMLVLFTVSVFGIGGSLTAVDNMAQIGQSLGYPSNSINTFVSLISIWSFAGRICAGFLSEIFLAQYKFPRPLALTAVLLISCFGHFLIAFGVPQSLYASSVILGFCMGAQWPLFQSIISEVFGLKYYSTIVNFGAAASPLGTYVLNVCITGRMYDAEAARQQGSVDVTRDKICMGVACFKRAFLIITAATFAGALVSLILVWRTWGFYKRDIYAKFKGARAAAVDENDSGTEEVNEMEVSALPKEENDGGSRSKNTDTNRKKETVNDDLH